MQLHSMRSTISGSVLSKPGSLVRSFAEVFNSDRSCFEDALVAAPRTLARDAQPLISLPTPPVGRMARSIKQRALHRKQCDTFVGVANRSRTDEERNTALIGDARSRAT